MITQFSIRNFKCFDQLDLPSLPRIILLGGRNNVGKTSLLEAFFLLFDRLNPQMIFRQFAWRGVPAIPADPNAAWAPIFRDYDQRCEIVLSALIDNKPEKLTLKFNPTYMPATVNALVPSTAVETRHIRTDQRPTPSYALDLLYESESDKHQVSHLLIRPDGILLQVDRADTRLRPAAFFPARMNISAAEDAERFGRLDILGQQDIILRFLQILEPRLRSLSSVAMGDVSLIHGDVGLGRKIPVSFMGDGVARLLSIILGIANSQGGVVLIDECENGIHYSVMSNVWGGIARAALEFDCQIIATTHSYECLQAAHQGLSGELASDFTYIRLDRTNDQIVAKTFDYELLGASLDTNMEVR